MTEIRRLNSIKVGRRHRKDLGDLRPLADSIQAVGLLHPVVVDRQDQLIAGQRRLEAVKLLGWTSIPVHVVDLECLAEGELAENACRKDFLPSELWSISQAVRERVSTPRGRPRKGEKVESCHLFPGGKTRDKTAAFFGVSGRHLEKIGAICESGHADLVEEMDTAPRSVHRVYTKLQARRQRSEEERVKSGSQRLWTITSDQAAVKCDLLICDPPYGITNEPWEPADLESFTRDWCRRWAYCDADFIAIYWSHERLFEGRRWFDESLIGYHFQQLLVWHASNHATPKDRRCLKLTWSPIFLYRRAASTRHVLSAGKTWDADLHNFDCHVAPVPQSIYAGEDFKEHPCQKPVTVMRWLIHALTEPGEKVASLFCGVAPCGIAAVQMGRRYHGVEIGPEYRESAEARIQAYGKPKNRGEQQREAVPRVPPTRARSSDDVRLPS
jgi:ParB-like nuclease domain/DNA methylase